MMSTGQGSQKHPVVILTLFTLQTIVLWSIEVNLFWLGLSGLGLLVYSFKGQALWRYRAWNYWGLLLIPLLSVFLESNQSFALIIRSILKEMSSYFYLLSIYLLLSTHQSEQYRRIRTLLCASLICASPFLDNPWIAIPYTLNLGLFFTGLRENAHLRFLPQVHRRNLIAWVLVGLLVVPTFFISQKIRQQFKGMGNRIWTEYFQTQSMKGFDTFTELGSLGASLSQEGNGDLMIRILGSDAPTYLKGMSYQKFHHSKWLTPINGSIIRPMDNILDHQVYSLYGDFNNDNFRDTSIVILHKEIQTHIFYGLETSWLGLLSDQVKRAPGNHLLASGQQEKGYYYLGKSDHQDSYTDSLDLHIDSTLYQGLLPLLDSIAGPQSIESRQDAQLWMAKMFRFFNSRFKYSYDVPASPEGVPPILDFLNSHRQGFCEYFATAAVLLARAQGIPARFVKGFAQPTLKDGESFYFRKNAHAWIEYRDPEGKWHTFDPTPGFAIPEVQELSWGQKLTQWSRNWIQDFGHFFSYGQWKIAIEDARIHLEAYFVEYLLSLLGFFSLIFAWGHWKRRLKRAKMKINYSKEHPFSQLAQEISKDFQNLGEPCPQHLSFGQHFMEISNKIQNIKTLEKIHDKIKEYEQKRFK